jgi:hypothetical protein
MGYPLSGNATHDSNVAAYEQTRLQAEVGATQAQLKTAYVSFYKNVLASALTNNVNPTQARTALRELGQWA